MPFDLQTLDWTAEVRPIYDEIAQRDRPVGRLLVRSDTGATLATCGPNFKPIQHQDVIDPVMQVLHEQRYDFIPRAPNRRDLEDLRGQRGAFVTHHFAKNGGIMRTTIITGDFINPTGPSSFLPDGPPTCFRQYDILNSHTGDYAAMLDLRYLVLKCMNGLASQQFTAKIKAKHTTGFSIDAFKNKVLAAAEMMENRHGPVRAVHQDAAHAATRRRPTSRRRLRALPTTRRPASLAGRVGLVEDLLARFDNEPSTVWGAYMAMTEWATHCDLRENAEELTSRVGRDERVARATRAPQFAQLLDLP
jgi:hypothetical protein